jgi:hypothetical protein
MTKLNVPSQLLSGETEKLTKISVGIVRLRFEYVSSRIKI